MLVLLQCGRRVPLRLQDLGQIAGGEAARGFLLGDLDDLGGFLF